MSISCSIIFQVDKTVSTPKEELLFHLLLLMMMTMSLSHWKLHYNHKIISKIKLFFVFQYIFKLIQNIKHIIFKQLFLLCKITINLNVMTVKQVIYENRIQIDVQLLKWLAKIQQILKQVFQNKIILHFSHF